MNIVRKLDYFLDRITIYRLAFYILVIYVIVSIIESFFGLLPFSPYAILASTLVFVVVCITSNKVISKLLNAPTNVESPYITALILVFLVTPPTNLKGWGIIIAIGLIAMASKYIFVYQKKHLFNPAAVAVVISGFILASPASWWIGTQAMAPFLILGGLVLLRKLRLGQFAGAFLIVFATLTAFFSFSTAGDIIAIAVQLVFNSSLIFMVSIMLTEPQTMPGTKRLRYAYASLVALLSVSGLHFGNFYLYPEQALVIGNAYSFLTGPKGRYILILSQKRELSKGVWEFVFSSKRKITFKAGQYLEWTLPHPYTDRRGARRFFTIASSPQEDEIKIGIKFENDSSSYKKSLVALKPGSVIAAANLWGNFNLPSKDRKVVLIAGGIGVTPYASMIRHLLFNKEKRDIALIYSNSHVDEISYKDLFDEAVKVLNLKVIYTLTDKENIPSSWKGRVGRLSHEMIKADVPDYKERLFYVSGSKSLIDGVKNTLREIGVSSRNIKTDYFPGYA